MIFVVGTGRCGTSTVARLLHTRCGVNMGEKLAVRSKIGQVYEDQDFSTLHAKALAGKITQLEFHHAVVDLANRRTEPWGMKCPATADFIYLYREWFPEARYIWCQRDLGSVYLSIGRVRPKMPEMERVHLIHRRQALIDWAFCDRWLREHFDVPSTVLQIDFTKRRDEEELVQIIETWIGGERC